MKTPDLEDLLPRTQWNELGPASVATLDGDEVGYLMAKLPNIKQQEVKA